MTTPEELDALVARLLDGPQRVYRDLHAAKKAATAITALRARVAELEAAIDQLQYIASANATRATPAPVVPAEGLADYDAGLLNDFGGGNVEWWQDYLRAEIGRANEHWRVQAQDLCERRAAMLGDFAEWTADDITALRSAPPVGVRVKPLQFEGHNGFWRADDGIGGFFEVTEVGGAFHMCRIVHGHANKLIPYATREDAFFACQVEHDRRILAALLPAGEGE